MSGVESINLFEGTQNQVPQQIQKQQISDGTESIMEKPKQKNKIINRMSNKFNNLLYKKNAVVRLVLHELKKENGSIEALNKDEKLKEFKSKWVLKYVKYARHFAVKNDQKKNNKKQLKENIEQIQLKDDQIKEVQQSPDSASTAKSTPEKEMEQIILNNEQEFQLKKILNQQDLGSDWSLGQSFTAYEEEDLRLNDQMIDNDEENNEQLLESIQHRLKQINQMTRQNSEEYQKFLNEDSFDDYEEGEFEIELQPIVCDAVLDYSGTFADMVEDKINIMNDIGVEYGELEDITEMTGESGSIWNASISQQEREFVETFLESFTSDCDLRSIPSEITVFNTQNSNTSDSK